MLFFLSSGTYCLTKDDHRWEPMCSDPMTGGGDALLGEDECISPFGIYELKIPVNKNLACDNAKITNFNCKDLDVSLKFSGQLQ